MLRRMVRDNLFRGRSAQGTLQQVTESSPVCCIQLLYGVESYVCHYLMRFFVVSGLLSREEREITYIPTRITLML